MVNYLYTVLAVATGAQALWLATADVDQSSNASGQISRSPYCQVGKGDTQEEAFSQASSTVNGIAIIAGGHCSQLPYQHTNQLEGFWDDYGTINYEVDNWHWYCVTGTASKSACDAGDGAPKRKRDVARDFKA
ncbi:hypothetical protein H9Q72_001066 [Fusarium xylarioides]|uniref:Uncharacterized protein n=1 Tax=Fusarium xylarioides TaxID=221167 RepID=A0A9P7I2D8_9HYPO|nr:hypothetical protein H9Q72_001066 [Fusarium xylarioides]